MMLKAEVPVQAALTQQIARLNKVEDSIFERMRHEVLTTPSDWVEEYDEFQSGGWWTLSLINDTGDARDVTIRDCERPVESDLLKRMPTTQAYMAGSGLDIMWARLAKLAPNSFLWEHRDYNELKETKRLRLHVPLVTNASCAIVLGGYRVHMSAGNLWRLDPSNIHGACNMYGPERIHLVMDCYVDAALEDLLEQSELTADEVAQLPALAIEDEAMAVTQARDLVALGFRESAERQLLELFYKHKTQEGRVYDLLAEVYDQSGDENRSQYWTRHKPVLLGKIRSTEAAA